MNNRTKSAEKSIDFLFLVSLILQYKWLIIIISGLSVAGVLLYMTLTAILPPDISPLPDVYHSTALILVNEKISGEMFAPFTWWERRVMSGNIPTAFSYGELALKLLKSNSLLDTMAVEFSLSARYKIGASTGEKIRQQIRKRLSLEYDDKIMMLAIGYEDYSPELTARITNRFVDLLQEMFTNIGKKRNQSRKELIEQKLSEVTASITGLEAKVEEFQAKYGVLDVDSIAMEKSTMMANLRSQLFLKDMELKTYSEFSTIDDPAAARLRAERNNLLRLIKEMESGFSAYQGVLPSQKDLPVIAKEYSHLKRDLLVQEKIYEVLIQDYELLKLSLEGEESLFQIIEYADTPNVKVGPPRMWICFIVTFFGLAFSTLLAFGHYWFSKKKSEFLALFAGGEKNNKRKTTHV